MSAEAGKIFVLAFCAALIPAIGLAQIENFAATDFQKADSVAQLYPHHPLMDLKTLSDKLTKPLSTEEEKFRAIYKWICLNIDNDYGLAQKNKSKRENLKDPKALDQWNRFFNEIMFETLNKEQKTVCTGYAYLVKELASYAGIPTVIINGYGRTAQANIRGSGVLNHSWNAIQLHHQWYLCDATWSSGAIDTLLKRFVRKYEDSYFLPEPSLFILNHYPIDSSWVLLEKKPKLQEFLNRPLVYVGAYRYKIDHLFPETLDFAAVKGDTVSFHFTVKGNDVLEKADLHITGEGSEDLVAAQISQNKSGLYSIEHVFTAVGDYVVHVMLNESYVFAYEVKVKKRK